MNQFEAWLLQKIKDSPMQALPFVTWMRYALYHPRWGYYQREGTKVGKGGDFFTSPQVGSLLGESLALILQEMDQQVFRAAPFFFVEVGGGDGRLARQVLDALQGTPLYERITYILVEQSPFHRQKAWAELQMHRAKLLLIASLAELPQQPLTGVIISNELLDAFPVHWLQYSSTGWQEIYVGWDEEREEFCELLHPLTAGRLLEWLEAEEEQLAPRLDQRIEVNLAMLDWQAEVSQRLERGYLLTIDYGATRDELYLPHRWQGTLRCYKNHRLDSQPLLQPGEKDITSHVNFSQWMERGAEQGLRTLHYTTQRQFLLAAGILQLLPQGDTLSATSTDPFSPQSRRLRALQQLIIPGGISDQFMVCVQGKGEVAEDLSFLQPFTFQGR